MSRDEWFAKVLKAAKPVAWCLVVVLLAVIWRVCATHIPDEDRGTIAFVGLSCFFLIPVFFKFGAYNPPIPYKR